MESNSEEGIRMRKQFGPPRPIEIKIQNGSWEKYDGDYHQDHDHGHGPQIEGEDHEDEEPLSPTGRLFNEPNTNVHILAIMGFKTQIDLDVLKANLPSTLLKHPRFSSLLVSQINKTFNI